MSNTSERSTFIRTIRRNDCEAASEGIEFHLLAQMLRSERIPTDWTGAFVVGLHRRAGVAPGMLDALVQQVALQLRDDLGRATSLRKHEEVLLEDVFLSAARTHAEMIRIHPFVDGNGRWARLVTSVFFRDAGLPCGTIILPKEKAAYIAAIDRAIDENEPGDLANILAKGFSIQAQRREDGRHPR